MGKKNPDEDEAISFALELNLNPDREPVVTVVDSSIFDSTTGDKVEAVHTLLTNRITADGIPVVTIDTSAYDLMTAEGRVNLGFMLRDLSGAILSPQVAASHERRVAQVLESRIQPTGPSGEDVAEDAS